MPNARIALLVSLCAAAALAAPIKRNTFKLSNEPLAAPNPGPTVLVHLGKGFKKDGPLNLIVHFHGIWNCVSVTAESKPGKCKPGTNSQGHNLIASVDSAKVNAALVLVEVAFNSSNTNPGKLAQDGFFASMIDELLPKIGTLAGKSYSRDNLGKLFLTSHSGGYAALCESLAHGGLPVSGVLLFDSLYPSKKPGAKDIGCFSKYVQYAKDNADSGRLGVVYTAGGGTLANSQQLSADVKALVPAGKYWDERKKADAQILKSPELGRPFVFVKTGVIHDESVRKYFAPMLSKLGL